VFANLRFLSHAETLRLFQRSCVRAGLDVAYSSGFNPRPRISLPLPRSVGLACEDEICCLLLNNTGQELSGEELKDKLNSQMPDGIELLTAESTQQPASFQSGTAVYEFTVSPRRRDEKLKERVSQLLANDSLKLQRRLDAHGRTRTIDVRSYLESVEVQGPKVVVRAAFGLRGSIRVEEILNLLKLDVADLDGPVTRTKVLWKKLTNTQN
jgi:radical SAM-linked protein